MFAVIKKAENNCRLHLLRLVLLKQIIFEYSTNVYRLLYWTRKLSHLNPRCLIPLFLRDEFALKLHLICFVFNLNYSNRCFYIAKISNRIRWKWNKNIETEINLFMKNDLVIWFTSKYYVWLLWKLLQVDISPHFHNIIPKYPYNEHMIHDSHKFRNHVFSYFVHRLHIILSNCPIN